MDAYEAVMEADGTYVYRKCLVLQPIGTITA